MKRGAPPLTIFDVAHKKVQTNFCKMSSFEAVPKSQQAALPLSFILPLLSHTYCTLLSYCSEQINCDSQLRERAYTDNCPACAALGIIEEEPKKCLTVGKPILSELDFLLRIPILADEKSMMLTV